MGNFKCDIRYGSDMFNAKWQNKTFKDLNAAVQFCQEHSNNIYGINGEAVTPVIPKNIFELRELLNRRTLVAHGLL